MGRTGNVIKDLQVVIDVVNRVNINLERQVNHWIKRTSELEDRVAEIEKILETSEAPD